MNNADLNPDSFDQAYAVLKRNADFLSSQQEPGIDRLLPLVEESMQAYSICKARLEAIQQALAQIENVGSPFLDIGVVHLGEDIRIFPDGGTQSTRCPITGIDALQGPVDQAVTTQ